MRKTMSTVLILLIFLLSGCTTTQQAMKRVSDAFAGKNIDDFVLAYSIPYKKHQLNNGEYVYAWSSGVITYDMPETTSMSGSVDTFGNYSGSAMTTGGGSLEVCCEVQIHTTAEGEILSIKPLRDTWGNWTTSRCSEIFK